MAWLYHGHFHLEVGTIIIGSPIFYPGAIRFSALDGFGIVIVNAVFTAMKIAPAAWTLSVLLPSLRA